MKVLRARVCVSSSSSSISSSFWLGGKRGAGVPGYGVRGPGMWKTRGVENAGCGKRGGGGGGKRGMWKTRGLVENAGSGGKHGV